LREIKYYQSEATHDKLLIPYTKFVKLVREITQEVSEEMGGGPYRWETDGIVALQTMSEHVIVMIMEMTYGLQLSG
jgi:histone H3/H4